MSSSVFNVHGSVHLKNIQICIQQDVTLLFMQELEFCRNFVYHFALQYFLVASYEFNFSAYVSHSEAGI